jgi:hypothetical protein
MTYKNILPAIRMRVRFTMTLWKRPSCYSDASYYMD